MRECGKGVREIEIGVPLLLLLLCHVSILTGLRQRSHLVIFCPQTDIRRPSFDRRASRQQQRGSFLDRRLTSFFPGLRN